jgi:microcystin-dependent protein
MTDPFVAEIRIFGFNFPPRGWAFCDGQLMPMAQNTALFALLVTNFGGDGEATFALPDLQGRAAVGTGPGPGAEPEYVIGQQSGAETVALAPGEIPLHSHRLQASSSPAELRAPAGDRVLARSSPGFAYGPANSSPAQAAPAAIGPAGSDFPHNNMPPTVVLNYCIALQGIFPPMP